MASSVRSGLDGQSPDESARPHSGRVLRWTVVILALGAFFALKPLWVPLIMAAWSALLARPLYERLTNRWRHKKQTAGALTVLLVVICLTPFLVVALSLASEATQLVHNLLQSKSGAGAIQTFFTSGNSEIKPTELDARSAIALARKHGLGALGMAQTLFGAATTAVIGIVVFVFAFYTFLVDGERAYHWFVRRSPLPPRSFERLASAFAETGRGLIIGVGLTALLQGIAGGIGYMIVGLPQALVLGLLTAMAALIPSVGSGLVWVPVTIVLFAGGRRGAALAVLVIGCVISILDNFVRPALSRYGQLQLPTFVLFVAMLGGIAAFGPWGLILGPLFVRLAAEGLSILRDNKPEVDGAVPTPAE